MRVLLGGDAAAVGEGVDVVVGDAVLLGVVLVDEVLVDVLIVDVVLVAVVVPLLLLLDDKLLV